TLQNMRQPCHVPSMTVHIGILGGGNISDTHARAARETPGVELVAYWGRDPETTSTMATRYGGRAYRDLEGFVRHRPMDAVLVGTPSGLHAEHARAAAREGLHVLVEKPLDVTTERIDALIDECDRAGVTLGVIFQDRTAPHLVWLKNLLATGALGAATSTLPGFPRRVELTGSEGTVIVEHDRVVSVQLRAPQHPPPAEAGSTNASATSPVVSDVRGHRRVLEDFLCAIRTGARPLCDGREGRRSVELVQALYRSARAGAAVALGAAPGA